MKGWFEVDNWVDYHEVSLILASSVIAVAKNKPDDGEDQGCVIVLSRGSITTSESYDDVIIKLQSTLEEN